MPTSLQSPNPNQTRLILPPLKHPHLRPLQSLHLSLPLPLCSQACPLIRKGKFCGYRGTHSRTGNARNKILKPCAKQKSVTAISRTRAAEILLAVLKDDLAPDLSASFRLLRSGRQTLAGIATILSGTLVPLFGHPAFVGSGPRSTWTSWHRTRSIPHRLSPWLPAMAEDLQSAGA